MSLEKRINCGKALKKMEFKKVGATGENGHTS